MAEIQFIKTTPDARIPTRSNPTDAGMDLYSAEEVVIPGNGGRRLVSTGLKVSIVPDETNRHYNIVDYKTIEINKDGYISDTFYGFSEYDEESFVWQLEVRPRSGLALKEGVTVLNSPGTIDSSYQGVLGVILVNHELYPFKVNIGDRIAQLIATKSYILPVTEVNRFEKKTNRGEGGFGSTGK